MKPLDLKRFFFGLFLAFPAYLLLLPQKANQKPLIFNVYAVLYTGSSLPTIVCVLNASLPLGWPEFPRDDIGRNGGVNGGDGHGPELLLEQAAAALADESRSVSPFPSWITFWFPPPSCCVSPFFALCACD